MQDAHSIRLNSFITKRGGNAIKNDTRTFENLNININDFREAFKLISKDDMVNN
jgi:hypothetical protein